MDSDNGKGKESDSTDMSANTSADYQPTVDRLSMCGRMRR